MEQLILTTFTLEEIRKIIKECVTEALTEKNLPDTKDSSDKLMTVKEASEYLNLSVQTIYGYTAQQLIPFAKRGKRLYFSKSELFAWVQEGRRKTQMEIGREADEYIYRNSKRKRF